MKRRRLAAVTVPALVAAVILGVAALPTAARDSHAPPEAGTNWLPCEDWVMFHWLPYSERRLYRLLGSNEAAVREWLRDDDHHTLAQLFARRGIGVRSAATRLVAPVRGRVTKGRYGELRSRARDTLTQGHLAQHVLFHYYHQPLVAVHARRLFGVAPIEYRRLRLSGQSPAQIAAGHHRSPRRAKLGALALMRFAAAKGVREHSVPANQARRVMAIQRRGIDHWLGSRIRKPGGGKRTHLGRLSRSRLLCFLLSGASGR